jgi:hypothetical protein
MTTTPSQPEMKATQLENLTGYPQESIGHQHTRTHHHPESNMTKFTSPPDMS